MAHQDNQKIFSLLTLIYRKIFPGWLKLLKKELVGCDSVLDLGCGHSSPIRYCDVFFSAGIELYEPYLKESEKKGIHNVYIKADIRKIKLKQKIFDVILCLDVLEHLTKKEGYDLIGKMEDAAKRKIIITTPNGYIYQDGYDHNLLQKHKTGWSVEELEKLGFSVLGVNGWKRLRGYKGEIKYRPKLFWKIISDLTQALTFYHPRFAFQLFAVKEIKNHNETPSKGFSNNS